jgi:hypothetical protein
MTERHKQMISLDGLVSIETPYKQITITIIKTNLNNSLI